MFIHVTAYCKKLIFLKTEFNLWNLSCYQPYFAFRCHGILFSILWYYKTSLWIQMWSFNLQDSNMCIQNFKFPKRLYIKMFLKALSWGAFLQLKYQLHQVWYGVEEIFLCEFLSLCGQLLWNKEGSMHN